VTVDYYSDDNGQWASDNCYPNGQTLQSCSTPGSQITPYFNFVKKETWGYCHNGKEFHVCQSGQPNCNSSYTQVVDSYNGTNAQILSGTNGSTATDYNGRNFTKIVDTGWPEMYRWSEKYPTDQSNPDLGLASNIFRLSGMADLGSHQTDTYVLSLSYNPRLLPTNPGNGLVALATRDKTGFWVKAVNMNFMNSGGSSKFVSGPYPSGAPLGTYGVDTSTNTAWAVINYNGDFAVASGIN
jgi:hypothetical protein